ncbi:hypothetical protein OESDEN_02969 [Oesophagostomum dentatum]|uniref:Uncharacterized protein n=1 Tax=Oesophagostomum dentatum TaxID=61180 RepID=A0A0B1TNU3_OESDE|nr:hypothetical protein OESDEN_02969 [Oesophagostomum dentatum]
MRVLLFCLALLVAVFAFPPMVQSRFRKSHSQDANIQPFIRFRKSSFSPWTDPSLAYN